MPTCSATPGLQLTRADLYTPLLGQSPGLDDLLGKIQTRIERELGFERELIKLRGALDMTLAQAAVAQLDLSPAAPAAVGGSAPAAAAVSVA